MAKSDKAQVQQPPPQSRELYRLAPGVEIQVDPVTGWSITKGEKKPLPGRVSATVKGMLQHGALIRVLPQAATSDPAAAGDQAAASDQDDSQGEGA